MKGMNKWVLCKSDVNDDDKFVAPLNPVLVSLTVPTGDRILHQYVYDDYTSSPVNQTTRKVPVLLYESIFFT